MSVQAMTWAFDQDIPPKPKMVLMALANRADRTTGKCFPGMDVICKEASVPERSLIRYIAALARNGYLIRLKSRDAKGQQRRNTYYLCLDREASKFGEWHWGVDGEEVAADEAPDSAESADEPGQIGDEPTAMVAPGPTANLAPGKTGQPTAKGGSSPTAIGGSQEPSDQPKSKTESLSSVAPRVGFSRDAQEADMVDEHIAHLSTNKNAPCFVIEGSRAWKAWCAWKGRHGLIPSMPTCGGIVRGQQYRGWYCPTLFPPPEPDAQQATEKETNDHHQQPEKAQC